LSIRISLKLSVYSADSNLIIPILLALPVLDHLTQKRNMKLLPLFLVDGRTYELPIVNTSCGQIILHDLVYKSNSEDLITECQLHVNGEVFRYRKNDHQSRVFHLDGVENKNTRISVDISNNLKISLKIACKDFSKCHCQQRQFQLNISANCEENH
jgi:hypothetical protein